MSRTHFGEQLPANPLSRLPSRASRAALVAFQGGRTPGQGARKRRSQMARRVGARSLRSAAGSGLRRRGDAPKARAALALPAVSLIHAGIEKKPRQCSLSGGVRRATT